MTFRLKPSTVTLNVLKSAICTYFCWSFLVFSILLFLFGENFGYYASVHEVDNKDITNLFLTYNALVLSFSLASITLVIALPSHDFVAFLAKEREGRKSKINPLKNLILSFFQAAFAHYVALTLLMPVFVFGSEKIPVKSLISTGEWISVVFLFQAWAFFLFGLALRDIASLGVLYSIHLAKINGPKGQSDPPSPT